MDVDIAVKLALPIGKSSYVPLSSSNGYLAYSTAMSNGIHLQRVYELKDENEEEDGDELVSSNDFFQKVYIFLNIFFIQSF